MRDFSKNDAGGAVKTMREALHEDGARDDNPPPSPFGVVVLLECEQLPQVIHEFLAVADLHADTVNILIGSRVAPAATDAGIELVPEGD